MPSLLRPLYSLIFVLPTLAGAAPADNNATPPVAVPAFLDVVTFLVHTDGENHKMIVTSGPGLMRVDEPDDRYSIIYNPQTEHYTGLEHGNYTYWEFSWPEVRAAVEASKRYEAHLQEMTLDDIDGSAQTPATNAPADSTAPVPEDNSGYVWHQTTDRKKIAGIDCLRWTGDSVSGESVEVWCSTAPLSKVEAAMDRLRTINDPVALVPVRTLVPDFVFPVYSALVRGGVTPVVITWGGVEEKNRFAFVEARTIEGKAGLFSVPNLYMKTTLITMDGLTDQKK
jgi:hypothetical protein